MFRFQLWNVTYTRGMRQKKKPWAQFPFFFYTYFPDNLKPSKCPSWSLILFMGWRWWRWSDAWLLIDFSFGDAVALGLLLEPPLLSGYKASVANLRRQVGFPFFLSCVLKERNTHFMLVLSEPHRKQITLQTT